MSYYKNEIIRGDIECRRGLRDMKEAIRQIECGLGEMEHGIYCELKHQNHFNPCNHECHECRKNRCNECCENDWFMPYFYR